MKKPLISIVIPTLNGQSYLFRTIDNLFKKAKEKAQIEMLVIDAGSSDATLKSVATLPIRMYQKPEDSEIVGGAFEFSFENPDWKLWTLQLINRIRYRVGQMYYGDQAVFCRKETAVSVGEYSEKQRMESAFFCRELKKKGKLNLIKKPIATSPRRFKKYGFFKVFWFDFSMWMQFILNLSVEEYGSRYWRLNLKSDG